MERARGDSHQVRAVSKRPRTCDSPNSVTTERRTVPKTHYHKLYLHPAPSCRHELKMSSPNSIPTKNDAPIATVEQKKVSLVLRYFASSSGRVPQGEFTPGNTRGRANRCKNGYHRCIILHRGRTSCERRLANGACLDAKSH